MFVTNRSELCYQGGEYSMDRRELLFWWATWHRL